MSKDMAELTSRLAITAIEQNELYQSAKRDAEEAEAYAASLESDMNALTELLQKSRAANVVLESALATARRDALEEAAKVAFTASTSTAPATERKKIATAIRALAAQEGQE